MCSFLKCCSQGEVSQIIGSIQKKLIIQRNVFLSQACCQACQLVSLSEFHERIKGCLQDDAVMIKAEAQEQSDGCGSLLKADFN